MPNAPFFLNFSSRWRTVIVIAALFILPLSAALSGALSDDNAAGNGEITFFRIGTGATSGTYFPIGGLIANAVSNPPGSRPCKSGGSCGVPGLIAVAQSTEGSLANIEAILSGTLDSGLSQADAAHWAYTRTGPYAKASGVVKEKGDNLRVIANLFPEFIHLVVHAKSGITSVADLKGKRVSLGEKESGTLASAKLVLKGYGLTPKKLKPLYLTPGQAADKMREDKLDALFLVAGTPVSAIADLAHEMPIALVPIADKKAAKIRKNDPFFVDSQIPAGTYQGVGAISTLSVGAQWLVSVDVSNDVVYGLTRALWHQNATGLLSKGHPTGSMIRFENALKGVTLPLHPGASHYYLENGLSKE